ncbi:MAG: methyl-accepting chemotaxis protein [Candidatus Omnitrophica bacterium]|nr:methyl-accepting chemotaxis protein [Candidatus Omnitrophota bacterium]
MMYFNRKLQKQYLVVILLSMVIPTFFVGGCLYYLIFRVLSDQIMLPDYIARDLMPIINQINNILIIGLPILVIFILAWAFILSYKFISPLERLEEDLKKIDDGDFSVRINLEEDHDLKPVLTIINDLVEKLEQKIKKEGQK